MTRVIGKGGKAQQPLRIATLAILFVATMLAAALLPQQIRRVLHDHSTSNTPEPGEHS